ncbi:hypothetical protein [Pseudomonas glycinae]|uniref:hypothetical protein n=1 Tax=Pseudomonas glycinae TaxID=1785145 RepID=UPI001F36CA9A|nr:hypothetical protein [Pseudomonas glycinae]
MNRAERVQRMLDLIDERLEAYPVEDTVNRLKSYQGGGPTIQEFLEGLEPIDNAEADAYCIDYLVDSVGLDTSDREILLEVTPFSPRENNQTFMSCESVHFDELVSSYTMHVSFLKEFSYFESSGFIISEDCRIDGAANDTIFQANGMEGYGGSEAA